MTARALLVVPPLFKYNAGPLLGPALLQAAARSHGHSCSILDLNALWIQKNGTSNIIKMRPKPMFQGDHNKPEDNKLSEIQRQWDTQLLATLTLKHDPHQPRGLLLRRPQYGFLDHEEIHQAAVNLADSSFGVWARDQLLQRGCRQMDLVGLSLLHAGQVIPAAAISMLARKLWPEATIAWGGPHISGLGHAIGQDLPQRRVLADVFVQGHAEETFVGLLDHVSSSTISKKCHVEPVIQARRGKFQLLPLVFENLECYSRPITLPAQSSLGCAYGKCAFCTYPSMEGTPIQLGLEATLGPVVQQALQLDGCTGISLKDSLVTTKRLLDIAGFIRGQVQWSACTKLGQRLAYTDTLMKLREGGLVTLEIGLESLLLETQRRIGKVQKQALFEEFVANVSEVDDLSIVVNYMTGFPWEDAVEAQQKLQEVQAILDFHLGRTGELPRAKVEHNAFELERLAPMALNPAKYGINEERLRLWPWASVVEQF
ncbi:expressed unknown protein [Seminavis robusta]|uniref:Elp3/MiaA/NifB-like radical SAM core domain-containing protein n=1 Tax=Seminavis robusta TaxID=568900 RepID=A0A9N8ERP4_9STRA|nr:expressed unknown protein [Seminavis robusta]|eukprot:Sro1902_g304430.1 n/a (486) ;mRNA; f:6021-7478